MIVPGICTNCNTRKNGPFYSFWSNSPHWARATSFTRYLDHTQRRTTVGRTPLNEWSAHRRDLYLTTHNTHSRQTSMSPVGFEPTISAGERPKTYALDRAATGTGKNGSLLCINISLSLQTRYTNWSRTSPLVFHFLEKENVFSTEILLSSLS